MREPFRVCEKGERRWFANLYSKDGTIDPAIYHTRVVLPASLPHHLPRIAMKEGPVNRFDPPGKIVPRLQNGRDLAYPSIGD
jgi:hypothetical protein